MANLEDLKLLRRGVVAWNWWRKENSDILPDLNSVNLSGARLVGANLAHTNLSYSNLSGANLVGADLSDADLSFANLSSASLSNTDLSGTLLIAADLSSAQLNGAYLGGANLGNAEIANANFSGAQMRGTMIGNVDLSEARNLEAVEHWGPSSVGIETVYKSRGKIPEIFLRGCGVPEGFITYMGSLTETAIEFYSCFISYSTKDEEFVKRLYADLQNEGVRCWFAPEDLKIGEKYRIRIDESIRLFDKLLLVLSEDSVASEWVEKEVETALEKEQEQGKVMLFPVCLDDSVFEVRTGWAADVKRTRHIGDFREWKQHDSYRKGFERLMRDLKAEAGREV